LACLWGKLDGTGYYSFIGLSGTFYMTGCDSVNGLIMLNGEGWSWKFDRIGYGSLIGLACTDIKWMGHSVIIQLWFEFNCMRKIQCSIIFNLNHNMYITEFPIPFLSISVDNTS
jgi:hypothetical protein